MKSYFGSVILFLVGITIAGGAEPPPAKASIDYQQAPEPTFENGLVRVWNAKTEPPPQKAGHVPEARLGDSLVVEVKNIDQWLCQNLEAGAWQTEPEVLNAHPIVVKIREDRKLWPAVRAGKWRESTKKASVPSEKDAERPAEDSLQLLAALKTAVGLDDNLLPARDETGASLDPTNPSDAGRIVEACHQAFLFLKGLRERKAAQFIVTINDTPLSNLPVTALEAKKGWRRAGDKEEGAFNWWEISLRASDDPESDKAWSDLMRAVGSRFSLESRVSLSLPNELIALPTSVTTTAEDSRCKFVLIKVTEAPRIEKKLAKGEAVYPLDLWQRSDQIRKGEIVEVNEENAAAPYVVHFLDIGGTKRYQSKDLVRLPPDPVPMGVIRIWNATEESPEWEQAQKDEVPAAKVGDHLVVEVRNFDGWLCNQIDQGFLRDDPLLQKASPALKTLIDAKGFSVAVKVGGVVYRSSNKTQITAVNVVRLLQKQAANDRDLAVLPFPPLRPIPKLGTLQKRSVSKAENPPNPSPSPAAEKAKAEKIEAEKTRAEQEQAEQEEAKKKVKEEQAEEVRAKNFLAPYREAHVLLRELLKSKLRSLDLTINDLPLGITPDNADFSPIYEARRPPADRDEDTYHWLRFPFTPKAKTAKEEQEKTADDPFKRLLAKPSFAMPSKVTLTLKSGAETLALPTAVTPQAKEKRCRFYLIGIEQWLFWLMAGALGLLVISLGFFACTTDILRDPCRRRPEGVEPVSLARTQMAFWFVVIAAAFLFLWMTTGNISTINGTCLVLLAIGTSTALGANAIGKGNKRQKDLSDVLHKSPHEMLAMTPLDMREEIEVRREELEAEKQLLQQTFADPSLLEELERDLKILNTHADEIRCFLEKRPSWLSPRIYFWRYRLRTVFEDLLTEEAGTYDFHRFQILGWTLVLGLIFVVKVFNERVMPTFDTNVLLLMGISSGAYLGFKKFATQEARANAENKPAAPPGP